MAPADAQAFVVEPNAGLLIWTFLALVAAPAGVVTAAKGRYGWLTAGAVTGGLLWIGTACRIAAPDSVWARRVYGPGKMRRAMAAFPRRLPHPDSRALRAAASQVGVGSS